LFPQLFAAYPVAGLNRPIGSSDATVTFSGGTPADTSGGCAGLILAASALQLNSGGGQVPTPVIHPGLKWTISLISAELLNLPTYTLIGNAYARVLLNGRIIIDALPTNGV